MRRILFCSLLSLSTLASYAKVELPPVFADNMVLQQQTDAALWGKAKPDSKVTIIPSWSKKKTVVTADADGNWEARIKTPEAGGPYEIVFNDGEKLTLKNVLIGEVWVCLGQSNMDMPMNGYNGQPVNEAADYIMTASPSLPIRTCQVQRNVAITPQKICDVKWYEHTPDGVKNTSATAYFFARKLHEALGVPVAVMVLSWGATPIQAWMNPELIKSDFASDVPSAHLFSGVLPEFEPFMEAGVLYNGMLHSVIPFTARGFLWYQGCANREEHLLYKRMQPAFVNMLRQEWGNDNMPFYFTQLAPFRYEDPEARDTGFFMWAQAQTLEMIPNSGMAATHDIGEKDCIHPAEKKKVGNRLAYLALYNDYGVDAIDIKPAIYDHFENVDGKLYVYFNVTGGGLSPIHMELSGFEVAGEDKVFYPAIGFVSESNTSRIEIRCPEVAEPVAIRYGMKNWSEATLFNCYGVPVSPFRSDDWER